MKKAEILQTINNGRKKIDELRNELDKIESIEVKNCIKKELAFLEDNTHRYELLAKEYGYI